MNIIRYRLPEGAYDRVTIGQLIKAALLLGPRSVDELKALLPGVHPGNVETAIEEMVASGVVIGTTPASPPLSTPASATTPAASDDLSRRIDDALKAMADDDAGALRRLMRQYPIREFAATIIHMQSTRSLPRSNS